MIATLAQDDPLGHPFWIAKVIEIQKSMQGQVASIVVQWFKTMHTNPLSHMTTDSSLIIVGCYTYLQLA